MAVMSDVGGDGVAAEHDVLLDPTAAAAAAAAAAADADADADAAAAAAAAVTDVLLYFQHDGGHLAPYHLMRSGR